MVVVGTPDLIISSRSVSDSTLTTGASFTLNATVRNQGDGTAASTTLFYYRSTDSTISSADTSVGNNSVVSLAASTTSSESISLTAPGSAGTYYYGACVNSVSTESDTSNNCSTGVAVTVSLTPQPPDLIVSSRSVSDSTLTTGDSFTLNATVLNQGTGTAASTTLTYYRSTNSTISSADTSVGTDSVSSLAASATSPESIFLIAPGSAGTYYYGACVDSVSAESDTSNNCSTGVAVTVSPAPQPPDLIISSHSVSDSTLTTGASFTLNATVRNDGTGAAASTTLIYYRSSDSTISSGDTSVGTDSVSSLAASATSPESIPLTAPGSVGTYYYGACVDSVSGETNASNNCSTGVRVTVSAATYNVGARVPRYTYQRVLVSEFY